MDAWDWIVGLADIENHDPEEPNQEEGNHRGSKPLWALLWSVWQLSYLFRYKGLLFFPYSRFRHWQKVLHN